MHISRHSHRLVFLILILSIACARTPEITFGVFTDAHFANRETAGTRFYRDSQLKVRQAVSEFNLQSVDFVIELGDFIDKGATVVEELDFLKTVDQEYQKFQGDRFYVLGNHDVATFSKARFLEFTGQNVSFYSFDRHGFHCVILDAGFLSDGTEYNAGNFDWRETYVPAPELAWLKQDLAQNSLPVLVFIHQPLDNEDSAHGVKNGHMVREVLEQAGNVLAVFQGHHHTGHYQKINGIHYITLRAMVEQAGLENNAFAIVTVSHRGVSVKGFGREPVSFYHNK